MIWQRQVLVWEPNSWPRTVGSWQLQEECCKDGGGMQTDSYLQRWCKKTMRFWQKWFGDRNGEEYLWQQRQKYVKCLCLYEINLGEAFE